nr:hypothetical protein [Tanacetum cinerariifolium]
MTANRINVIDMSCEEYSHEFLAFLNDDPSLPPPNQGNYLLEVCKELKICEAKSNKSSIDEPPEVELKDLPPHLEYAFSKEVDAFLALEDDPTSPEVDQSYVDTEGDILLLEAFLNDDPSLPPPNEGNYLPEEFFSKPSLPFRKDVEKHVNTEEKKYILSLHKIHAKQFLEVDLEEKMNHWVRKEFKTSNEDARIITDQPHGLDFMEQIIVMRENDKPNSFSKADFKYVNKNDIEDFYYLCRNRKVNYQETNLMNSLITFIRSRVIWKRVHDFQLEIESSQIKVNLTAPTLTFHGIEAHEPYSIVDKPSTCLIYLNSKDEKQVMYLTEIVKFCDATPEKVLKEVKLKIFHSEPWRKPPLLCKLDRDILRAFESEITKRLSHRE